VLAGKDSVTFQTGYKAEDNAIAEADVHFPNSGMLPTKKISSPNDVVAVSRKVTETLLVLGGLGLPSAPV